VGDRGGSGPASVRGFGLAKIRGSGPATRARVDSGRVIKSGAAREDGLRRSFEAVGRELRLGEHMTFDTAGYEHLKNGDRGIYYLPWTNAP
jgi:hypothetical protein